MAIGSNFFKYKSVTFGSGERIDFYKKFDKWDLFNAISSFLNFYIKSKTLIK